MRLRLPRSVKEQGDSDNGDETTHNRISQNILKPILFCLGHCVNTFVYFLYYYITYDIFCRTVEYLATWHILKLHILQRMMLEGLLIVCISYSWSRYLTQGFDGDAFSHVLYWHYRLINKREMVSRFIGALFGGVCCGMLLAVVSRYYHSSTIPSHVNINATLRDCADCLTFAEIITLPFVHIYTYINRVWLYVTGSSIPKVSDISFKLSPHSLFLLENFIFEFLGCLAIYLVLTVTLVLDRFGNGCALYAVFKRMTSFSLNSYLLNIDSWVSLDAAVTIRRYFVERDLSMLLVRLLANFMAVTAAATAFNPMSRLRHCDFVDMYVNVSRSKKQSMLPKNGTCAQIDTKNVVDSDIKFSVFPQSILGTVFTRLTKGVSKVKKH
ncbi:putative integral membrane protein [Babesia bovis T2Bo]|uniref:Uncharacterized protein n=1 Tax=Babesia bovis TaxID=5865 RepID=A7APA2_BABBO|nr:putative integral membrane protein [Babesia bovis T2Bo]EDO08386.1 putative integral membrane protein [Babesia bovis T2Bo]|eukprot:XP_001611954.1 hypothetical protein [Babesia bovis T2Bo]